MPLGQKGMCALSKTAYADIPSKHGDREGLGERNKCGIQGEERKNGRGILLGEQWRTEAWGRGRRDLGQST